MHKLILIKHSLPEIDPQVDANRWHLSPEGKRRSRVLAEQLAKYDLQALFASPEPKAQETAQIAAARLDLTVETIRGLHEHRREKVPFESQERFEARVMEFFRHPERLIFGQETADQAHQRFKQAIGQVLEQAGDRNTAVVAHGTVISLLVSRACDLDPIELWGRLGLPSYVVLSMPGFELEEIVEKVEGGTSY